MPGFLIIFFAEMGLILAATIAAAIWARRRRHMPPLVVSFDGHLNQKAMANLRETIERTLPGRKAIVLSPGERIEQAAVKCQRCGSERVGNYCARCGASWGDPPTMFRRMKDVDAAIGGWDPISNAVRAGLVSIERAREIERETAQRG